MLFHGYMVNIADQTITLKGLRYLLNFFFGFSYLYGYMSVSVSAMSLRVTVEKRRWLRMP